MSVRVPTSADLGRTVRRLRRARGLSIERLASIAGCDPTDLSDLEHGVHSPTWSELGGLTAALHLPISTVISQAEREAEARDVDMAGEDDRTS